MDNKTNGNHPTRDINDQPGRTFESSAFDGARTQSVRKHAAFRAMLAKRIVANDRVRYNAMPSKPTDEVHLLRNIIAAMWEEYNTDEHCDYVRINKLIEDAAKVVADNMGGYAQLDKLARNLRKLGGYHI